MNAIEVGRVIPNAPFRIFADLNRGALRIKRPTRFALFAFFFFGLFARAAEVIPPAPQNHLNDYANVIRPAVAQQLNGELAQFKTVVVDSIGETQALGLRTIMRTAKNPDLPGLQDYGKSNEQIGILIRGLRGLAQAQGVNVVITALAVESKDENTGAILTRPALTPKALELATGAVDMLGYMTQKKDGTRVLNFQPSTSYMAKLRQPATGAQIPLVIENPTLPRILEIMRTAHPKAAQEGTAM